MIMRAPPPRGQAPGQWPPKADPTSRIRLKIIRQQNYVQSCRMSRGAQPLPGSLYCIRTALRGLDSKENPELNPGAASPVREAWQMTQTLMRKWWLPAFCAVFYAIVSFIFLIQVGHVSARFTAFAFLGSVTLAAGVCTAASGILRLREGRSWLLVLNGLACGALGLIFSFGTSRPIGFRTIALLIVVMATSIGIYELAEARSLRCLAEEWLLGVAGAVSIGFAFVFLAFRLSWIKLEPSPSSQTFRWLGFYFAFSAICALGLVLHPGKTRPSIN